MIHGFHNEQFHRWDIEDLYVEICAKRNLVTTLVNKGKRWIHPGQYRPFLRSDMKVTSQ